MIFKYIHAYVHVWFKITQIFGFKKEFASRKQQKINNGALKYTENV